MRPADWMQAAKTHRLHSMQAIIAVIAAKTQPLSVAEVADPGKDHRDPKPVCSLNHLGVAH